MSGETHEIVTLQFGHYSNFVGTHWWNNQEATFVYDSDLVSRPREICHDVLFREGCNLEGDVTYTPRLVALDLKGSLNTLKQDGSLYDLPDVADDIGWSSDVTMHKYGAVEKNEFLRDLARQGVDGVANSHAEDEEDTDLKSETDEDACEREQPVDQPRVFGPKVYDLDDNVKVWSDFLRLHLHPKTVGILDQYSHNNESEAFELFTLGQNLYRDHKTRTQLDDQIHYFVEECDHLQGIHLLADVHTGFGGLAGAMLQQLEDDLGSKSLMVFAVSPPSFGKKKPVEDNYRIMSMALTLENLISHSSCILPLSLAESFGRVPGPPVTMPHVIYKPELAYHTSAILATCLDNATLPYRLENSPSLLQHVTQAMTPGDRKVVSLYGSLPIPLEEKSNFVDSLLELGDTLPWQPLTPGCRGNMHCVGQSVTVRGLPPGRLKGPPNPKRSQKLNRCTTLQEVMSLYLEDMYQCSLNAICPVMEPFKVVAPYPHIFSPQLSQKGLIRTSAPDHPQNTSTKQDLEELPLMTSLQSTNSIRQPLQSLLKEVRAINFKRHHKLLDSGLEEDEYCESLDSLQSIIDQYTEDEGAMA